MERLFEAKNLDVYKKLLRILSEYCKTMPMSGMNRLFDQVVEKGMKILPKDKLALEILDYVLQEDNVASSIQDLLNMRFSCLPPACLPQRQKDQKIASWKRGELISDKIKDLINWEGTGTAGSWSNSKGEKVNLIDMSQEKKE